MSTGRSAHPVKKDAAWVISERARKSLEVCELFRDLDSRQLMEVAALVEEESRELDELLLREGEAARYVYVIINGRGVAQLEMYRGWLSLGLVGPGDAAGWSSLVGGQPYPASVKALTPMQIARIESKGLALLMNLDPAIGHSIHKRLSALFCRQYRAALETFKITG